MTAKCVLVTVLLANVALRQSIILKQNTVLKFERVNYYFNTDIANGTVELRNIDEINRIFIFWRMVTKLNAPLLGAVDVFYEVNGIHHRALPKMTLELCALLANRNKNQMFIQILHEIRKTSKIPLRCPVKKTDYAVENMVPQPYFFPVVLPSNRFRFDVEVRNGKLLCFNISVYQVFVSKN